VSKLAAFASERNANHMQDVVLKGVMGLAFTAVTFGAFYALTWLFVGIAWSKSFSGASTIASVVTAIYFGVAAWSAWRKIDPVANLAPLTRKERARREVEDAVRDAVGGGLDKALRRDGIAGFGNLLIAGPASLVGAWEAWRKRLPMDPDLLAAGEAILGGSLEDAGHPVGDDDGRGLLALLHLGLVRLEVGPDGELRALATAKAKNLDP
jgi:hypothetical protein